MNKKILIYSIIAAAVLVLIYFLFVKNDEKVQKFTFGEAVKGDISNTITSTGTLEALSTVDVGTQVSGRIDKIFVDFNSNVKKGQLLAVLDTTSLALQVSDAQSSLIKAQAQYEQSDVQFKNDKSLYDKGFLSVVDYITSKTNLETAKANLQSAKTALERAKTNLTYAYIYSPIRGKIISRNVEEGQTVAASLQAPTLFIIAEDLSKMQILASVDESDIGQIKVGQKAEFTVQAYPEKEFKGKVVQIRLNSEVVQNVVNYTVVINSDNKDNLLLPGMTATIDFYVEQKNNVLLIPNSALRFQPTEEMLAEYKNEMQNIPDSVKNKFRNRMNRSSFGQNNQNVNRSTTNFGRFWYLNNQGKPQMGTAVLGLTDGKNTEVVRSRILKDGMKVITGIVTDGDVQTNNQNMLNSRGLSRGFRRF